MSLVAHYCQSLSRFPRYEATRSIPIPPGWDASPLQVTSQTFAGTLRVKGLAQEHNTMTWPGLEPGPLDPESSVLTTRPPRLPENDK